MFLWETFACWERAPCTKRVFRVVVRPSYYILPLAIGYCRRLSLTIVYTSGGNKYIYMFVFTCRIIRIGYRFGIIPQQCVILALLFRKRHKHVHRVRVADLCFGPSINMITRTAYVRVNSRSRGGGNFESSMTSIDITQQQRSGLLNTDCLERCSTNTHTHTKQLCKRHKKHREYAHAWLSRTR